MLNSYKGHLLENNWEKASVGVCFDGASVMMGKLGGVAKKIKDCVEAAGGSCVAVHAVAHVTQICNGDAFKEVVYYQEWRETTQELYVEYNGSGKRRFGLEVHANELDATLLKLTSSHGIRWAAAQERTIKAVITDLPVIVVDLEKRAKSEHGLELTQLTPSNVFYGKQFWQKFDTSPTRWKATVTNIIFSDSNAASDKFVVSYSDKTTIEMSKAELVDMLTDEKKSKLMDDPRWCLRKKVTKYLYVAFSCFMLDVHNILSILSRTFQSNKLVIFDVPRNINKALRSLDKLRQTPGDTEASFNAAVAKDSDADVWGGTCRLYDGEEGRKQMKVLRIQVIDGLQKHLTSRFEKVLDNETFKNLSVFHTKHWPPKDVLKESYIKEVRLYK